MPDALVQLRRGLGEPVAPDRITQEPFDFDDGHLRRLARLKPTERAAAGDLWNYTQDLRYTGSIQTQLLLHVLPFALQAWHEDLRGADGYGGFVVQFYPALLNHGVFETHLKSEQSQAVSQFMRDSIIEEIDDQRGLTSQGMGARAYRWIGALATHGVLFPDVERLWMDWWSLETSGRAIAAVQYISALMYPVDENPIFAPWTHQGGGGPPCLWDWAGDLFEHRWRVENVTFLERALTPDAVGDVLRSAAQRLEQHPEGPIASRVLADLPARADLLAARGAELPRLLATIQKPETLLEWSR
jgi:hypothetical protein